MSDAETATDESGQYSFTGLRAGTYSVEISGFDAGEIGFSSTSGAATVGVGESKVVSFDGTYLRTAGIVGQVSVDGEGLAGVTVNLSGHGEDATEVTDAGGLYSFSKLRSGTYQVAISGYDADDYEFEVTSKTATIATGETANVPFEGTLLRTAGIAGRVSVAGMGLDGVTVTLAGAAEASTETSNGGQYAFAGLAAGTYVVSIANPNDVAYNFETTSTNVELMDDQSAIVNFDGTHTRTASVTGMMYLDEAPQDKMYTANEPALAHAGIPVALQGPGINDVAVGVTMDDGSFAFEGLTAGAYRVLVNMTDEVAAAIETAGFAFAGDLTGTIVNVEAGGNAQVNFPFRITTQTLVAGARMGNADEVGAPVAGVELALYANADMTGMLGEATTDDMGMATFDFARADNTGPTGNDNIVFVKVKATGHDALVVSENDFTEVSYAATDRTSSAPAAAMLVNVMANFQFWVKSDAEARGGDMGLGGWHTEVYMGDPEADDAMPLMMVDADGDTVNATMPTDTAMASRGRSGLSYMVDPDDLPATFTVMVGDAQAGAMGEKFEQSDALEFTHTGLAHPDMNTAEMNDLGPIYVTFTTQTLTVGVYREVDDEPGWTDYRAPMGGDARPDAAVAAEMSAELMTRDSRGRLRPYEYDHDGKATTDPISSMAIGKDGMASFPNLPANAELTVRFQVGSDRMLVGETDIGDIDAFGQDLDIGMSYGSFGDEGGAMPEVKLCSMSTDKDDCATFAYQWKTGSVSGSVAGPGGASVSLSAETDADDRSTKTGSDSKKSSYRKFSISDIQDGEYTLSTPNTADNSFAPKGGFELGIYHDETEDDEDEDTDYVGTAWSMADADFTATKLRLAIKGFVANDGGDGRARGNEAMAGVTVRLLQAANAKDTAYTKVAATAETDDSGLYSFENLTEGAKYRVDVVATDDYAGLRSLKVSKSGVVRPDEYPAKGVTQEPLMLPSWNHATNMASGTTPTASADAPSTVSATLQNFALVYKTSNVSGFVNDVGSSTDAGIIVESAICRTYTPGNDGPDDVPGTEDDVAPDCNWQREDVVSERTVRGGDYDFNGLLEGYYAVWYTGGGLAAAELDADGDPDDDATGNTSPTSIITSVMGRNQYSTGNDFHVYNTRAGTADVLTELVVKEFQADGDSVDLGADISTITAQATTGTDVVTLATTTIEFASGGVTIRTKQSPGASARAMLTTAVKGRSPSHLPYNATGTADAGTAIASSITVRVTAANGYNDHDYTFEVTRAAPRNNVPESLTADGTTVTWAAGEFVVEAVASGNASADIVIDLHPGQTASVTVGGDAVACEAGTADATIHTCTVTGLVAGGQTTAKVEVTSEDGVKAAMSINLQRASG